MNATKRDADGLLPCVSNDSRESKMVVIERDGDGVPSIWCDPEIADIVRAMNSAGIRTVASCSGHGLRPGRISLADGRELILLNDLESANRLFSKSADGVPEPSDAIKEFCTILPWRRAEDLMNYVRAYGRECYEAGEQCRAASEELEELRAWKAEHQAFLVRLSVALVVDGGCKQDQIEACVDELIAERDSLRALSRGVPEGK